MDSAPALAGPSAVVEKLKDAEEVAPEGSPGRLEEVSAPITEPTVSASEVSRMPVLQRKPEVIRLCPSRRRYPPVLVASSRAVT